MAHVDYDTIAESLNEWMANGYGERPFTAGNNWLLEKNTGDAIIGGGSQVAKYLLEEHGVIITKTMYREHFDGVRLWLRSITDEEVTKTVTETQYTFE